MTRYDLTSAKLPRLLQVQPELWRRSEVPRQSERRVRAYSALSIQNQRDPVHRHGQRLRQGVGRQAKGIKLIAQYLARMHWPSFRCVCSRQSPSVKSTIPTSHGPASFQRKQMHHCALIKMLY